MKDIKFKKFKMPPAILKQLKEFSKGFFLVIVNEQNAFETYASMDDPLTEVGLLNYLEIQAGALQAMIRDRAENDNINPEEKEED